MSKMRRREVRQAKKEAKANIEKAYQEMVKQNKFKHVENIITGEIFKDVEEAAKVHKMKVKQIQKVLDGKRKYAGKDPLTNERYEWRYAQDNEVVWFNEYKVR